MNFVSRKEVEKKTFKFVSKKSKLHLAGEIYKGIFILVEVRYPACLHNYNTYDTHNVNDILEFLLFKICFDS